VEDAQIKQSLYQRVFLSELFFRGKLNSKERVFVLVERKLAYDLQRRENWC
jgi:hypothetical protein